MQDYGGGRFRRSRQEIKALFTHIVHPFGLGGRSKKVPEKAVEWHFSKSIFKDTHILGVDEAEIHVNLRSLDKQQ